MGYGVHGKATGASGYGVYGEATQASTGTYGVYGKSQSELGRGVFGHATATSGNTFGVYGKIDNNTDTSAAGYFEATGNSGPTFGVWAENKSTDNGAYAIYADKTSCVYTDSYCYGVYTPDRMYAKAFDTSPSDVAEYLPAASNLQPGDVVMIDPGDGGGLVLAEGAYNTAVAGIISTQPGVALGSGAHEGSEGNEGQALLALAGTVPCRVSAENGPIHPGDLLTTSTTPGHAMRAEVMEVNGVLFHRPGTILGKALEGWDEGIGTIVVLVTLQ